MFEFLQFQATAIKKIATKTTNAIIMTGLGIGIGSVIFLSLLRHIFKKSQKIESISDHQEQDETDKENSTMVLLITSNKHTQDLTASSSDLPSNSFISSSPSSSFLLSSEIKVGTDDRVTEIKLKAPPELMLLEEEDLRDRLKDDYIVLVIPRKSKVETIQNEEEDDYDVDLSKFKRLNNSCTEVDDVLRSLRYPRNSFDLNVRFKKLLEQSIRRSSFPLIPSQGELKRSEVDMDPCEDRDDDSGNVDDGGNLASENDYEEKVQKSLYSSMWLANHDLSVNSCDSAYMFTSSDMRSIFENDLDMSHSLSNCGSDVMKKLTDIEEKLCLVHVDTNDMMSYINAVKKSEKLSNQSGPSLYGFVTSTPGESSLDRSEQDEVPSCSTNFTFSEELDGNLMDRNFEEWSYEELLGDPNDISF